MPPQFDGEQSERYAFGPPRLLSASELGDAFGLSSSWVYKHIKRGAPDPLPVIRIGSAVRFDPYKVAAYLRSRERNRPSATLNTTVGNAGVSRKGTYTLTRRRFQTGSVRLRQDRGSVYWQGFYREDVITESGRRVRKRIGVNLGTLEETPNETVARQKLAVILQPLNDSKHKPKKMMTFGGFIPLYRAYRMANQKGTTVHGYETNIRAHFLPAFAGRELSEISSEDVQIFLNEKRLEDYAVQTLRNMKWGLSAIFECAIKYEYITFNPAARADIPPDPVQEDAQLPSGHELRLLIDHLEEPIKTLVWLVAVSCIRPDELAFKWKDLNPVKRELKVVRAVNQGKIHTPKTHRSKRPIRLTEADVQRLLALRERVNGQDEDWVFPNRIRNGKRMKPGPIWHETLLARRIQPVARDLGLPHITWRLLRHWGATQLIDAGVKIKTVQYRLGHSRPDVLLERYAHVLAPSQVAAARTLSAQLDGGTASEGAA